MPQPVRPVCAAIDGLTSSSTAELLLPSTDVSEFAIWTIQTFGTFSANFIPEGSNNNVDWVALSTADGSNPTAIGSTFAGATSRFGIVTFRYLRIRLSFYSSGTVNASLFLSASAAAPLSFGVGSVSLIGTTNVKETPGTTGGLTPYRVISAASNNAAQIKSSSGQIYAVHLVNTSGAIKYVKFYGKLGVPAPATDNASLTHVFGIPAGADISHTFPGGLVHTSGIGIAIVAGSADTDNTSVGAGDVIVNVGYK